MGMAHTIEVPPPIPAKNTVELKHRMGLYGIPDADKFTEDQAEEWVNEKAMALFNASPLPDRNLAWEFAHQCAIKMHLFSLAYAAIKRQQATRDQKPTASELVKASNIQSKIPPMMRALGLIVLYKDNVTAAKKQSATDPFSDE